MSQMHVRSYSSDSYKCPPGNSLGNLLTSNIPFVVNFWSITEQKARSKSTESTGARGTVTPKSTVLL